MKKPDDQEARNAQDVRLARRARLQALLFSGAALLMLAGGEIKMPRVQGE